MWNPIETAPPDRQLLLFCPHRHVTDPERIEIGFARSTRGGWWHSSATHWAYLPTGPNRDEVERILAAEAAQAAWRRELTTEPK